ncbi:MAG: ATP-binding protein [Candidatus Sphingomonas phytovorans]|nr:ATP-binding protein [Sphingomonas sp.]WEK01517.1 MAG: ATP-binding protein [Sphingomonas sp.]
MPGPSLLRRCGVLLAAVVLALAVAWIAGRIVDRRTHGDLATSVAADARLRQGLLTSEIARYRLLPLALSGDSDLAAALGGQAGATAALNVKLERLASDTGAAVIYAIGRDGRAVAASNWRTPSSFVGQDYRFRPYYRDALRTSAGEQFALGIVSGRPGLYLSRRSPDGGVVVVKLEFDAIERQWRAARGITWVTNRAGVILIASRADWRFAATAPIDAATATATQSYIGITAFKPSPVRANAAGRAVVTGERDALVLERTVPDALGWTVNLAMPDGPAIDTAVRTAQIAAGLAVLALFGLGWAARDRSRRNSERTTALESAVAARTADLRHEIEERAALEARAADLREGLRQANRLAALGQITASVAHETAQPVAAIRTYAATSEQLLDRGELDDVRANLAAIARLATRIGEVTTELRGFARKGSGSIQPVPLVEIIEGARLILKERLSRAHVAFPAIPEDLTVMAGRVRLEQVIVNVLQNATEALEGRADPAIAIKLALDPLTVRLTIADNGPGIAADVAARLFTPFVTSRPTGLGLGLVIAQDIMVDLGGALRLLSTTQGACFEIELRRA